MRKLIVFTLLLNFGHWVHASPMLKPGATLTITEANFPAPADGSGDDCEFILLGTCQIGSGGQLFGVRTTSMKSFSRGQGLAFQYYDIDVDSGDGSETALLSQISGKAIFNGFIALVGGGQVSGSLKLKVIDLGLTEAKDPDGGKVVHEELLASHQLKGQAVAGPTLSVTVEGGAPYIGVGGSPGFTFNAAFQKELVRDNIDFGIHVLLIRGHSYRLQFETNTLAKKGVVQGLSIAQFMLGDDRAPDILDPQHWIDGVNDLLDTSIPAIGSKLSDIKEGNDGIFNLFEKERVLAGARGFSNANQILAQSGLPTSFTEIITNRLHRSGVLEERLPNPGAEIKDLFITLQTDQVELLREQDKLLREIIRLQLTPSGRRSTDVIDCNQWNCKQLPQNSNGGGNGNGDPQAFIDDGDTQELTDLATTSQLSAPEDESSDAGASAGAGSLGIPAILILATLQTIRLCSVGRGASELV